MTVSRMRASVVWVVVDHDDQQVRHGLPLPFPPPLFVFSEALLFVKAVPFKAVNLCCGSAF